MKQARGRKVEARIPAWEAQRMSAKIEDAQKTIIGLVPRHRAIALSLSPKLVEGIRQSLDLTQTLIDAAMAGDEDAAMWLARAGIETATASNGVAIVIGKDGNIGAWIVSARHSIADALKEIIENYPN